MRTKDSLIDSFLDTLRRRRWLLVTAFAAMLTGLEAARYTIGTQYEFDQAYRVLLFGVALPLLVGIAFSLPSEFGANRALVGHTRGQMKRRVLVATREMLLGSGIESMLVRQKELDLVGITLGNKTDLIKKISRLKPEVVILDETTYLVSARDLLALLTDWPEIRLVVVSASENRVQIYNKRQILVTQSTDLVEMMCRS